MTRSRRNAAPSSSDVSEVASRVGKLELSLQNELKELKDQLSITDDLNVPAKVVDSPAFLEKINSLEKKMLEAITTIKGDLRSIEKKMADQQRERMANCLIINGVKENGSFDSCDVIAKIISTHFKVEFSKGAIDYCYRLGKATDRGKMRPLAVRFVNRWLRDYVFNTKKCLKGSGIVVNEFLSTEMLSLYKSVRERVGARKCWTWRGKVYISENQEKRLISKISDIDRSQ